MNVEVLQKEQECGRGNSAKLRGCVKERRVQFILFFPPFSFLFLLPDRLKQALSPAIISLETAIKYRKLKINIYVVKSVTNVLLHVSLDTRQYLRITMLTDVST
jgi:hypothetical protein